MAPSSGRRPRLPYVRAVGGQVGAGSEGRRGLQPHRGGARVFRGVFDGNEGGGTHE